MYRVRLRPYILALGCDATNNVNRLQEPQEKELAAQIEALAPRFEMLWENDDYAELMGLLRELRPFVDAFFDHVMVMCEDPELRQNRLNLLKALVDKLARLRTSALCRFELFAVPCCTARRGSMPGGQQGHAACACCRRTDALLREL